MKSKLNKIRGLILLLLLMVLSANSKFLVSVASESEKSINTENIVATADAVLEKYINYENETAKGLLVQYGVNAGIEYKNNENYVPLTATGLLFNAPKIEEEYPTSVNIIAKSTLLTNGSNNGKDYKFVYKQETGEIAIVASNNKNEEGKIYEGYKQNAKDSFSIILNYGENAYNNENKERNIEVSGKVVEALNTTEKTRIQNNFENKQTVKENVSKLVSTKVENTKVYNGYIKSNAVNGTDYETTYKENVQINISKENLGTQKIDLTQKFVNKENVETESENLVFKSSKLEKQNIIDILGEEGSLKILDDQENVLADINKDTQNNEDGTIKIDYPEGTNKIILELSNATKTGNITIQNEKAITAQEKNFELAKIKETYNQDEVTDIEIQDSKTEVIIEPSQTTWTNEKQNEVEFKISLHNNSNKYNLFKNPVIAIQLPEETEKVLFNEKTTITNANGLKIKNTEYNQEKRIIKVELEGEQTKYLSPALEDGTIIKIPAIIILSNNIESKEFNLKSAYQNENKYTGKTETEVLNNKIILENFNQSLTQNDTMQTMTRRLTSVGPTRSVEGTQGVSISVNPVIGDVTRDTVYEGEFIKYEITATNTTEEDIDNVKIVATLPDGVTYGELVREDHEPYVESYYDFEKQLQPIELGTIKAGKNATTYFEVKVNDLAERETQKQITTNIKAFVGENLSNEKEITHQVEKAEYKISMSSNVYKSKEFQYTVKIKGNVQEKTDVKVKLPECIEPWAVVCDLKLFTTSKDFRVLENENAIVFEIEPDEDVKILEYGEIDDGIKEYEYQIFTRVISSKIEKTQNMSNTEISAIATIGNIKSNENRILLEYQTISLSMTSNNEGEKVKFGDSVTYNIEIVNNGKNNYSNDGLDYIQLNIKDYLPDELVPQYIKYNDYEYDSENNEFIKQEYIDELSEKATDMNGNVLPNIDIYVKIPYQEKITIEIKTLAGIVTDEKKIINKAIVSGVLNTAIDTQQTEEISHTILPDNYDGRDSNETNNEESIDNPEETGNPEEQGNTNSDVPEENEIKKYNIAGYVWNDKDEDGEKQNNEKVLSEIQTFLLNGDGEVVKETKTDNNGKYSFADLNNGEYYVVFNYNANQYRITTSNVTKQYVVINEEKNTVGVTEQIILNKNIEDINLGLVENKKFDFKVDNYISKITVKTKSETTETSYSKANLAKTEIKAKEIEGAVVTVEYKIVVTNNGELPGKVGKVIDYLPQGLNLASESISSWTNNTDGSVINTSLANKTIEAGESVELTLLATITMTENSIGTLTNNVKIDDLNNELGIQEINLQNNESKTELILSINTGLLIYVSVAVLIVIAVMIILNIKFNIFKNIKFRFLSFFVLLVTIMICIGNSSIKAAGGEKTYYEDDIDITLTADKRIRYRTTDQGTDSNGYHSFIVYHHVDGGAYLTSSKYIKLKSTDYFKLTTEENVYGDVSGGGITVYSSLNDALNGRVRNYYSYAGLGFSIDEWKRIMIDFSTSDLWDMKGSCSVLYKANDWRASMQNGEINAMCADPNIPATNKTPQKSNSLGIVSFYERGYDANYYPTERHVYKHTMQETEAAILDNSKFEHDFMYYSLSITNPSYIREMQNYKDLKITDNGERYNSSRTIKLKEKNELVIIGPFNIKSSSTTNAYNRMTLKYRDGSSVNLSPCKSNGDFLTTSLKGNTGNFYFRVNKNDLISHKGIAYIEIKSSDEPVDYQIGISGDVVKYYYRDGEQDNNNGYHEYQRFVKAEEESFGNYVPKYEYIEETFKTKVSPNTSIKYNCFQGALTIHKEDEIGTDENGNTLSMEGIYFAVNRKGYGWVERNADGTYGYNSTWNESKAVKLRTNSDGTTDTIVGLEPLAHYIAEEGNSNGNGVYMVYEIIKALPGGNSAYDLPEHLRDYYKATYPNGLYGCPYALKAIENGNVDVSRGHYTGNKVNLKDSDPDNDGNHIWIESGEFWYSNSTNTRDYVSLQIQKKDHYKGTFDTGYGGFKFKVCKQEADGTYKWVRKVNPNDEHSDVVYGSFNAATELTTQPDGKTEVLRRLESGAKYWFVETAIPTELQDYYTLRTVYEPLTTSKTYETYVFKAYNIDTTKKIKVLSSTAYKFTLLEPLTIYAKKPSGSGTTNVVQASNGIYTWTGYNPRDYFTIQIEKKNKDGNLLNDMKFAILIEDSTSTATNRKGKWLTADSNGIYKGTLSTYESMKASEGKSTTGVFTTGEKGKLGYTRLIKRIPLPAWGALEKKYTIFEIDAPGYEYLYNVGTFNFNGQSKKGEKLETLTVNDDFRETLNKWPNGYDVNNKRLFNCCIMTCTNQQDFGAIRFRKVDQLTQTPLKGIEIKIKCTQNGNGWLKIEKNKDGRYVVTSREATYDEATPLVTDENGYTVTVWKMPTRVESGGKVIYAAFETYIPEDYQDYFALNADYLEKCPTTNDADLKKYDQFAVYDASTANANAINRAMGWNIRERDYAKALKGCTPEEKIDKNNKKMPEVIEFKKENEQTFIDISGNVWQDTKKLVKNEYQRDDSKNVGEASNDDKNINNITVRLMKKITDKKGTPHTIEMARVQTGDKKAGCNGDGDYKFSKVKIKDLANYFIEFDYCGMTYEAVIPGYTTEKITLKQNDKTIRKNVLHPDSKTSKATETTDRTDLNNAFGELKGEGRDIINYNGRKVLHYVKNDDGEVFLDNTYKQDLKPVDGDKKTIELNAPKGRKYDYIVTASIDTFKDGNTDKNIIQYYYDLMAHNQTTHMLDGYEKNGHTLLKEIPNLNLGLYLREQPMLSLQKDVYKADMQINGKQFTYRYDGRIKNPDEIGELEKLTGIIGVKFDGKYTLPMYDVDVNYTNADKSKELKTTVTYKIKLQNSSGVLDSYVHELTDISSKELKIARRAKDGKPLIYLMDTPDATNEDFFDANGEPADPIELGGDTVLEQEYNATNLKGWRSNIRFKDPIKLDNRIKEGGHSIRYLYIVFDINIDDIKELYRGADSTNDLFNVVEISSYSVTKHNNENNKDEKYAHVDNNSIPNNVDVNSLISGKKNGKAYTGEDDDDRAPGLKIIKPTQRQITGIVFEDMPVQQNELYTDINQKQTMEYDNAPYNKQVDPGEERVGDGIYNTSGGNNMYTNGSQSLDQGISGVRVKLVDSEGNPAKFWDSVNHRWNDNAYVTSKDNGTFDLTGFIPGDYHIEFVWGDDLGGKDVSRYKCTILTNPFIQNKETVSYENEIKYLVDDIWYRDPQPYNWTANRYSDAKDDYIRRLAIDKLRLEVDDAAYDADLLEKINNLINEVKNKTDDSNLNYMHSSTPEISIEVEKYSQLGIDGQLYSTDEQTEELKNGNLSGLGFNIINVDFGIIERPKRAMSIQKRIKSIKITTPEGRPVVIATIGIDGKVNAIAGERFISGGYSLGYLYAQIDKDLEQSMKVETEYDITVSGLSELDYDSLRYYLFGLPEDGKQLKLKATNLYDYSGGATITTDGEDGDKWQAAHEGDPYLNVSNSPSNPYTATEYLIMNIYEKLGRSNTKTEDEIVAAMEDMNLFSNYQAFDNSLTAVGARKSLAKIYSEFIDEWEHSEYKNYSLSKEVIRALKLKNREVVQCNPDNILVKDPYYSTESRVGTIKTSKIIANGDDIKIENDVEIASVAVDKTQKTGATPDPTYAPLYDRAEYVTVSPAQGEDKDYIGKAIVGIGILTVLASGIILIKRKITA